MYSIRNIAKTPVNHYAFAVNPDNFEIVVSSSGHNTILRTYSKFDFSQGGWAYIKEGKLIFNCGSLGNVKDKDGVKYALESYFHTYFSYAR